MKALHPLIACAALIFVSASASAQIRLPQPQGQSPAPAPAQAASPAGIVKRVTVQELAKLVQDAGYRAEVVQGTKEPYIRTGLSGRRVAIYMYDCQNGTCGAYQFSVIYTKNDKYNLAYVNEWNKKKRYAKTYLDNDGDLNFEWDIDLDGGVTPEYLKTTLSSFEVYIGLFDKFTM